MKKFFLTFMFLLYFTPQAFATNILLQCQKLIAIIYPAQKTAPSPPPLKLEVDVAEQELIQKLKNLGIYPAVIEGRLTYDSGLTTRSLSVFEYGKLVFLRKKNRTLNIQVVPDFSFSKTYELMKQVMLEDAKDGYKISNLTIEILPGVDPSNNDVADFSNAVRAFNQDRNFIVLMFAQKPAALLTEPSVNLPNY